MLKASLSRLPWSGSPPQDPLCLAALSSPRPLLRTRSRLVAPLPRVHLNLVSFGPRVIPASFLTWFPVFSPVSVNFLRLLFSVLGSETSYDGFPLPKCLCADLYFRLGFCLLPCVCFLGARLHRTRWFSFTALSRRCRAGLGPLGRSSYAWWLLWFSIQGPVSAPSVLGATGWTACGVCVSQDPVSSPVLRSPFSTVTFPATLVAGAPSLALPRTPLPAGTPGDSRLPLGLGLLQTTLQTCWSWLSGIGFSPAWG